MTVLLLLIMDYRFTGNAFHEIGGVVLVLLFIFHNVLNWRWYQTFFKGRQSLRGICTTAVNLLLMAAVVTVLVTGVLISVTVFAPLSLRGSSLFVHDIHQGAGYVIFLLSAIHLGLHWEMIITKLKNWLKIEGSSLSWALTSRVIAMAIITYGVYASFVNNIGTKLFMQQVFIGWGAVPSLWGFLLDYLSVMGCYVGITHYLFTFGSKKAGKGERNKWNM